jgi:membrane protease YdiL (CAAX protease family)
MWVARHPLPAYVALAYLWSWAYWWPLLLADASVRMGVGWPSQLPGLIGPALAAVVVTWLADGRPGVRALGERGTRWRAGAWWWSVPAILAAGAIGLLATGRLGDAATGIGYNGVPAAWPALLTVLAVFVVNGVGEELGWRGFLTDRLLQRRSLVTTALLVALVWAPWHLPLFLVTESFQSFAVAHVVGWAIGLTAGSVVLTWLYRGSGRSVLLVAAWHTAFNLTSATPVATGAVAAISSTVVMVAAVAIVVLELRGRRRRT